HTVTADNISSTHDHATVRRGRPDAFLARELTDSILHFVGAEIGDATLTTTDLAEWVVKIVRELGQPALAQAYEDFAQQRQTRSEPAYSEPVPALSSRAELTESCEAAASPIDLTWRCGEAHLRDYSRR